MLPPAIIDMRDAKVGGPLDKARFCGVGGQGGGEEKESGDEPLPRT